MGFVLDANSPPDVRGIGGFPKLGLEQLAHAVSAFGEHLIGVPFGGEHDATDLFDVVV